MSATNRLALPFIDAAQAQKHVTHNEALIDLDALVHLSVKARNVLVAPVSPVEGDRYLVGANAQGAFAVSTGAIAAFDNGGWSFLAPRAGWRAFVEAENILLLFDGTNWNDLGLSLQSLQNLSRLGVGAVADAANPLSAKLNGVLLSARATGEGGTGDLRVKLNKSAGGNIVSQIYQTGFSGRAETGLAGDDHFHVKVSPDGATWAEAINIDPASGLVSMPHTAGVANGVASLDANSRLPVAQLPALAGDVAAAAGTGALTLAASGVAAGAYGSSTSVATLTVDAKGRVTSASSTPIAISAAQVSGLSQNQTPLTPLLAVSSSANQFDLAQVSEGFEVYSTGAVQAYPTSSVSGFVYIAQQGWVTLSGLPTGSGSAPWVVFYADDAATIVSKLALTISGGTQSVAVPAGAAWMRFTTRARAAAQPNYAAIQVQYGQAASAYVAYANPQLAWVFNRKIFQAPPALLYTGQKNLFDVAQVSEGFEVYGDGSTPAQPNSAISGLIFVAGQTKITLSGLQAANGFANIYCVFYAQDGAAIVQAGLTLPPPGGTLLVPSGAFWFRFAPRQRNASAPNYANIQVEYGGAATARVAWQPRVLAINGVFTDKTYAATQGVLAGKAFGVFGTSKDETATVGDTTTPGSYTSGVRENWPTFAMPWLGVASWWDYAKSGASYIDMGSPAHTQQFQNMSYQIQRALADGRAADVIYLGGPTNDQSFLATNPSAMGDYATAMAKTSLAALDRTKFYEALRWAMWSVRTNWPAASVAIATTMQRADFTPDQQAAVNNAVKQMAAVYSIHVIDVNAESGIVGAFETMGATGRYLLDGIHETPSTAPVAGFPAGTIHMARFMAAKIAAWFAY